MDEDLDVSVHSVQRDDELAGAADEGKLDKEDEDEDEDEGEEMDEDGEM